MAGYLFVQGGLVLDASLVVDDGLAERDPDVHNELAAWCSGHRVRTATGMRSWRLGTVSEFSRGVLCRWAYKGRCTVLGADPARTLGLLAIYSRKARKWGWRESFVLGLPGWGVVSKGRDGYQRWTRDTGCPRLYVQAVGVRGTRIAFGAPRPSYAGPMPGRGRVEAGERWGEWEKDDEGRTVPYPGRFVDLTAAAFALDGIDSDDLAMHLEAWGIPPVEPHAVRPDPAGAAHLVELLHAQHRLAVALDAEAAACGVELRGLHSPGTLAETTLTRLGVVPQLLKYRLPAREYRAWTEAMHGGWVTSEVTGQLACGGDLDIRSAYPTLAHHLDWWRYLTAATTRTRRVTRELRAFLGQPLPALRAAMRDSATWRCWGCTRVVVRLRGEPWPLETVHETNHSISRLVVHPCEGPELHGTWLDAAAATVRSGHPVELREAVQLVPEGNQPGLRAIDLFGLQLDPGRDPALDLVRHRTALKQRAEASDQRRAAALRGMTNAMFGNLARFDPTDGGEKPGPWCWPPLAATVTSAARCVLALMEADLNDRGLDVVCRDTDGLVVRFPADGFASASRDLHEIAESWDSLAVDDGRFWQITEGTPEQPLEIISFGLKRYAVLQRDHDGQLEVTSATEHVIGTYAAPSTMSGRNREGRHDWTAEVARAHANAAMTGGSVRRFVWEHGPGVGFPALRRRQLTTPDELAALPEILGRRPFVRVVEAVLEVMSSHVQPMALDPGGDLAGWRGLDWFDARTGEELRLTTDPEDLDESDGRAVAVAEPLQQKALDWTRPRRWLLPAIVLVDPRLMRRVGRQGHRFLTGYADTLYADIDAASIVADVTTKLGVSWLTEATQIPDWTLRRLVAGARRPRTIKRVMRRLHAAGLSLPRLLDVADGHIDDCCLACGQRPRHAGRPFCTICKPPAERTCATPECTLPVRQAGARCPRHRTQWDRQRRRRAERRRRQLARTPAPPRPRCAECQQMPAAMGSIFCARCARASPSSGKAES
jgi:hypothetical protein